MSWQPRTQISAHWRLPILAAVLWGLSVSAFAQSGSGEADVKPRIWSDISGKFQVEASFVELKDGQISLKKPDGRIVTLPLEKLSLSDQEIAHLEAERSSANPFAGGTPAVPPEVDLRPSITEEMTTLLAANVAPPWSLAPDAGSSNEVPTEGVALRGKRGAFFERPLGLLFAPPEAARALVVHVNNPPGDPPVTRLEWCDLGKGRAEGSVSIEGNHQPLALSPNGEYLLTHGGVHDRETRGRLDVWRVADGRCEKVSAWTPYETLAKINPAVIQAEWVDSSHVLTLSGFGKLVLWELAEARAIWLLDLSGMSHFALSPTRKYVAAATSAGLQIHDPLTGKLLGRLSNENSYGTRLAFRADGERLAVITSRKLQVWDFAGGELFRELPVPTLPSTNRLDWIDDNHVLLGGAYLLDIERRLVLWKYESDASVQEAAGMFGGAFWHVASGSHGADSAQALIPVRLPHAEALRVAASLSEEDYLSIRPGTRVSVELKIQAEPDEETEIREALVARLEQNGLIVADGQPVKLIARTSPGKTYQIEYRSFGFGRGTTKAKVTPHKSELLFEIDGETVWQAESVASAPPILHRQEGETIKKALARLVKPNLSFFQKAWIPTYVSRPTDGDACGTSKLTASGPT